MRAAESAALESPSTLPVSPSRSRYTSHHVLVKTCATAVQMGMNMRTFVGLLQEFCALVNDQARSTDRHGSYCGICMDGGDLLCCDGCPTAVHPFCIGLEEIPDVSALCPS